MGVEIERKYLVTSDAWRQGAKGRLLRQGYLSTEAACAVRVRLVGREQAYLTVKGRGTGIARPEFEYEIPVHDAEELLQLCRGALVEKTRYEVRHAGHRWEVDEFHGANDGLILAEIELTRVDETFALPSWVGEEVSSDARYQNARLAVAPYGSWTT